MAYGGNDFSATQFAGGGFIQSQAGTIDNAYGGGAPKKSSTNDPTLRAVTIRMLLQDNLATADTGEFKVDGMEITTVTFVGRVQRFEEKGAMQQTKLVVDDGTASIEVCSYTDDNGSQGAQPKPHAWQVGSYVRVVGTLRSFQSKLSVYSYCIRPVSDPNEVSYHFLQVVFQHVQITKGAPPAPAAAGGYGNTQQKAGAPPSNQYVPGAVPSYATGGSGAGGSLQDAVLQYFSSPEVGNRTAGVHLDEVESVLRSRGVAGVTRESLLKTAEFLCNEGQLYSTTDEHTFRMCA